MIFFLISLLTYFCYQTLKMRKALLFLEKNKYSLKKYQKWMLKSDQVLTIEILSAFLILIAFIYDAKIMGICTLILYMLFSLLEIKKTTNKFKITKQNMHIFIITLIIYLLIFGFIIIGILNQNNSFLTSEHISIYYLLTIIIGYLLYFITFISLYISKLLKNNKKH